MFKKYKMAISSDKYSNLFEVFRAETLQPPKSHNSSLHSYL